MQLKLLLICYFDPLGLLTVRDSINTLRKHSKHEITVINLFPHLSIHQPLDLSYFNGLILHNTVAYDPQTLYTLDNSLELKKFKGIKVLFKQDEHVRSHQTARFIGEAEIDLVLTCLPKTEISKVYPREWVREATFLSQYTSYISDDLIKLATSHTYPRSSDIAYRGSIQPLQCGVLGYEKWSIGAVIQKKLGHTSLKLDISSNWSSRIHGTDWIRFLLSTKATLGAESGSNLFDFTGQVEAECRQFEQKNKKLKQDFDKFYHQAHAEFLHKYENNVYYAQVSPRHFEAAATKTLQILYEGKYSGIFEPYRHYLPLKKDLSNIDEIKEILTNTKKQRFITDCAFEEIALNPTLQVAPFVKRLDEKLSELAGKKKISQKILSSTQSFSPKTIMLLVPYEPHLNPRIQWLKEVYSSFSKVVCIGITNQPKLKKYTTDAEGNTLINLKYSKQKNAPLDISLLTEDYTHLYYQLTQLSQHKQIKYPLNSLYHSEAQKRHQEYCMHILSMDSLFREVIEKISQFNHATPDLLIAVDLSSLLSGVSIAKHYQIPLIYDMHPFNLLSNQPLKPFEIDFWSHYETILKNHANLFIDEKNDHAEILLKQTKEIMSQYKPVEKITDFNTTFLSQQGHITQSLRKLVKNFLGLLIKKVARRKAYKTY